MLGFRNITLILRKKVSRPYSLTWYIDVNAAKTLQSGIILSGSYECEAGSKLVDNNL